MCEGGSRWGRGGVEGGSTPPPSDHPVHRPDTHPPRGTPHACERSRNFLAAGSLTAGSPPCMASVAMWGMGTATASGRLRSSSSIPAGGRGPGGGAGSGWEGDEPSWAAGEPSHGSSWQEATRGEGQACCGGPSLSHALPPHVRTHIPPPHNHPPHLVQAVRPVVGVPHSQHHQDVAQRRLEGGRLRHGAGRVEGGGASSSQGGVPQCQDLSGPEPPIGGLASLARLHPGPCEPCKTPSRA